MKTRTRVLRDGSPAPFCFLPKNPHGEIPVALGDEQRAFLESLDPDCLTPGERRALRKRWADDGCRLTDCCGVYSTFFETTLVCRKCYEEVEFGEGDGTEWANGRTESNVVVYLEDEGGIDR